MWKIKSHLATLWGHLLERMELGHQEKLVGKTKGREGRDRIRMKLVRL